MVMVVAARADRAVAGTHRAKVGTVKPSDIVWVVEINFKDGKGWMPTVGVGLTRDVGRAELREWQTNNPGHEEFLRLRKYTRS